MGIFGEFFGNSLGILWEFFRNSLEIVTKVSWLCLFTKSIVSYLGRFGFLSRFCLKAEGQEFRSLEVRASISHLKIRETICIHNGLLSIRALFIWRNLESLFEGSFDNSSLIWRVFKLCHFGTKIAVRLLKLKTRQMTIGYWESRIINFKA